MSIIKGIMYIVPNPAITIQEPYPENLKGWFPRTIKNQNGLWVQVKVHHDRQTLPIGTYFPSHIPYYFLEDKHEGEVLHLISPKGEGVQLNLEQSDSPFGDKSFTGMLQHVVRLYDNNKEKNMSIIKGKLSVVDAMAMNLSELNSLVQDHLKIWYPEEVNCHVPLIQVLAHSAGNPDWSSFGHPSLKDEGMITHKNRFPGYMPYPMLEDKKEGDVLKLTSFDGTKIELKLKQHSTIQPFRVFEEMLQHVARLYNKEKNMIDSKEMKCALCDRHFEYTVDVRDAGNDYAGIKVCHWCKRKIIEIALNHQCCGNCKHWDRLPKKDGVVLGRCGASPRVPDSVLNTPIEVVHEINNNILLIMEQNASKMPANAGVKCECFKPYWGS